MPPLRRCAGRPSNASPQDEQSGNKPVKRTDDTMEPVFFHALPYLIWEDLVLAMNFSSVIDLTCSDGMLALACLKNGLPYCGVPFTPFHTELLQARLAKLVTEACLTEGDPLYDASFAKALLGGGGKRGGDVHGDDPNKKPKTGDPPHTSKPKAAPTSPTLKKKKEKGKGKDKDKDTDKDKAKAKDNNTTGKPKPTKNKGCTSSNDPFFSESDDSAESGGSGGSGKL